MSNKITVIDSSGGKREVNDTPENVQLAKDNGFQIERGLVDQGLDFWRGSIEGSTVGRATKAVVDYGMDSLGIERHDKPIEVDHSGKITVVDSKGGRKEVSDNEDNRKLAADSGFQIESVDQTKAQDILARPEYQGARGAGHVFQKKMESEYLYGLPEMAQKSSMTEPEKMAWEKLKDDNKAASYGGSAIGIGANLATPGLNLAGGASKAVKGATMALEHVGIEGTSLIGKIAQRGMQEGSRAAVYSAPHIAGQAIFEDPVKAGESWLATTGIGVGLGAVSPVLGKIFAGSVDKATGKVEQSILSQIAEDSGFSAENRFMKNIGVQKAASKKLTEEGKQDMARLLLDAGINEPFATKAKLTEKMLALKEKEGKFIGETGKIADNFFKAHPDEIAASGFQLSGVGAAIDTKFGETARLGLKSNVARDRSLKNLLVDSIVLGHGKEAGAGIKTVEDAIATMELLPGITIERGQAIKNHVAERAVLWKHKSLLNENEYAARKVYGAISGGLEDSIGTVADKIGNTELVSAYQLAKKRYGAVRTLEDMGVIENMFATAHGNNGIGLTQHIHIAGAVQATVAGHPGALAYPAVMGAIKSTPVQSALVAILESMNMSSRRMTADQIAERFASIDGMVGKVNAVGSKINSNSNHDTSITPMAKLVGSKETDPQKIYAEAKVKFEALVKDPEAMNARFEPVAKMISDSGDPEGAFHYMQQSVNAINYLYSQMPKGKVSTSQFHNREYKPTAAELSKFNDIVAAAQDPFYVIKKIEDGKMSKAQIDTLKAVYPALFSLIKQRIETLGSIHQNEKKDTTMPYSTRLRIQRLTGIMADPSMDASKIAALQKNYQDSQDKSEADFKPSKGFSKDVATPVEKTAQGINRH